MKTTICKYIGCVVGLIALFALLMTAVYAIPNDAIEWHREYSLCVLDIEKGWESQGNLFGMFGQPGMMDNTTDRVMMESAWRNESQNAFQAAMSINGYARYWHGYQVFVRPLLVVYQYYQIRYLNVIVFIFMLLAVSAQIKKRLGRAFEAAFWMTMICAGITVIPVNMQYMPVFMTALTASLVLLIRYPFQKKENLGLFFMAVGMVTNFLDFLTFPLVSLGVPMMVVLALDAREDRPGCFLRAVKMAVLWGVGYGLCWMSKWLLANLALDGNVMDSVLGHASQWAGGGLKLDTRLEAVRLNFRYFFLQQGIRTMILPLALEAALVLLAAVFHDGRKEKRLCAGLMIAAAGIPYAWYFVMAEHSILHAWFTYRNQTMTLLGGYFATAALVDWKRVRAACQARMRKR